MTSTSSLVGSPITRLLNLASLWVIFGASIVGGLATLTVSILGIVNDASSGSVWLSLLSEKRVPLAGLGGSAGIAQGGWESALVRVNHLDPEALGFALTAEIAATVVPVTLWALVAFMCWRLVHKHALRRSLSRAVGAAGIVLIIGGLVESIANVIASGVAARQLNTLAHNTFWPLDGRFDGSLAGIGFVLLVVALVFEYGAHLQKDTEGLV